jgi:hypothetical protein
MKQKVNVPLFFFVNLTELDSEEKRNEVTDWFNLVGENTNLWRESGSPFSYGGNAILAFIDIRGNASGTVGAREYWEENEPPESCVKVEYEFWKEHIKDKTYDVVSAKYVESLAHNVVEIKQVLRPNLVLANVNDSNVIQRIDSDIEVPMYDGRLLLDPQKVNRTRNLGYHLQLPIAGWFDVDGYDVPEGMKKSAVARGYIFKCQVSGKYSSADYETTVINEEGEELRASRNRASYIESCAYDLKFTNQEAARNYGYDYCEVTSDWKPEDECKKQPNAAYHNMMREHGHQWRCSRSTDFTIGFEIEKEDEDMKYKYPYQQLFDETNWIKESDSSLCGEAGYELVSPVFNLMDNSLDKEIENNQCLQDLINATYNIRTVTEDDIENDEYSHLGYLEEGDKVPSCGGHINIGSRIYTPIQLFFGLKGFLPLLYTVYDVRVDKAYSEAKPIQHYLNNHHTNDHHSALQIKDNVVELRIVAAVRNVKNLLWRRDLVRIMIKHINKSEQEVLRMMLNPNSLLSKHLKKVYKSDERYMKKCNDFVRFSEKYNDVKLPGIDWDRFKR